MANAIAVVTQFVVMSNPSVKIEASTPKIEFPPTWYMLGTWLEKTK
jgi:hypothetical protein